MADKLNSIDPLHNNHPRTEWQVLGKLKLQVGSSLSGAIDQWLTEILDPLNLPIDFTGKILKSIEQAAVHVLSPDDMERIFEFLEIVVLAQTELTSQAQIWGFFRVERGSIGTKIEPSRCYYMEYYLYLDRKRGE